MNKLKNDLIDLKEEHQKEYDLIYILHIMKVMKRLWN
jgi:hypothetical protein